MSIADFGKLNYGWDTTMYLQWTDEKENEREREREGNANHLAFNTHTHTHTQKCTYTYTCNICLEWEHTRTRTFTHRSNYCIPNFKHWCKEHGPYHSHNHTHTHTHTHTPWPWFYGVILDDTARCDCVSYLVRYVYIIIPKYVSQKLKRC